MHNLFDTPCHAPTVVLKGQRHFSPTIFESQLPHGRVIEKSNLARLTQDNWHSHSPSRRSSESIKGGNCNMQVSVLENNAHFDVLSFSAFRQRI